MKQRTLDALRALAERPGTEAEGILARELLERHEKNVEPEERFLGLYEKFMRTGSIEDLLAAVGPMLCECGLERPAFTTCMNSSRHEAIRAEGLSLFPKGTRIFYNMWAYKVNESGVIVGNSKLWNWRRIKFDSLKNPRAVPVYSRNGWHISREPLDAASAYRLGGPGSN